MMHGNTKLKFSESLFVWVLSYHLSGKGGPTSSYGTSGIALWIIAPRKPPYPAKDAFVKVEILQGGCRNKSWHEEDRRKTGWKV